MTPIFLPLLSIVFITLKLLDVIAWSWWWVLAPLWVPLVVVVVFAGVMFYLLNQTGHKILNKTRK